MDGSVSSCQKDTSGGPHARETSEGHRREKRKFAVLEGSQSNEPQRRANLSVGRLQLGSSTAVGTRKRNLDTWHLVNSAGTLPCAILDAHSQLAGALVRITAGTLISPPSPSPTRATNSTPLDWGQEQSASESYLEIRALEILEHSVEEPTRSDRGERSANVCLWGEVEAISPLLRIPCQRPAGKGRKDGGPGGDGTVAAWLLDLGPCRHPTDTCPITRVFHDRQRSSTCQFNNRNSVDLPSNATVSATRLTDVEVDGPLTQDMHEASVLRSKDELALLKVTQQICEWVNCRRRRGLSVLGIK